MIVISQTYGNPGSSLEFIATKRFSNATDSKYRRRVATVVVITVRAYHSVSWQILLAKTYPPGRRHVSHLGTLVVAVFVYPQPGHWRCSLAAFKLMKDAKSVNPSPGDLSMAVGGSRALHGVFTLQRPKITPQCLWLPIQVGIRKDDCVLACFRFEEPTVSELIFSRGVQYIGRRQCQVIYHFKP
ncbi:hypothetical protein BJV74DRAFT_537099 [Russula compacta]|nr:hypothetical protein BJV74DRAFT_537099 [Russula compacta]